jgi:diguanylate cyclase (GGDEF)-like protein
LRLTDFDDDYLGHTAGDWFIRVLADRLREGAEGPNLIARLGGDEFVVAPAVPMDADTAEALACRLQSILCERVAIDGEKLTRTVSIGVALGVPSRDTTSDLLRRRTRPCSQPRMRAATRSRCSPTTCH